MRKAALNFPGKVGKDITAQSILWHYCATRRARRRKLNWLRVISVNVDESNTWCGCRPQFVLQQDFDIRIFLICRDRVATVRWGRWRDWSVDTALGLRTWTGIANTYSDGKEVEELDNVTINSASEEWSGISLLSFLQVSWSCWRRLPTCLGVRPFPLVSKM
jgi:hypothetical protein